jgi:ribosomal protein S6--L-glutamate ligase
MTQDKLLIGSEEWFSFATLGIPAIKARVDSGAKTSSIHAVNIEPFKRKGEPWVSFEVHPLQGDRRTLVRCEAPVVDRRMVRSSSGDAGKRYVICVPISMGDKSWDIEVTLANRDSMGYRMLLGREAMVGRTIVDPGGRFIHGDLSREYLEQVYGSLSHGTDVGLTIGLLASKSPSYTCSRLVEAAEERGHKVKFLDIKHCYMKLDGDASEIRYHGGYILADLDAVVARVEAGFTRYGCALVRQCESMGVFCLNSATATLQARDTLFSLQTLLEHGISTPVTGFADSPLDTKDLIGMVGGAPLVIKLLDRVRGQEAVVVHSDAEAESVINALKSIDASLLVQEYVKEAEGKGLRCMVVDGKVVAAVERPGLATGTANIVPATGPAAITAKPTAEEKKLAAKAAKVMGLGMAGIDIIRSRRGPLLLNVDPAPDLEALETASNRDLAGMIISAVERKVRWQRQLAVKR